MSISPEHYLVLGICPENYRADHTCHFIRAVADLYEKNWRVLGNGSLTKYQPSGDFYAIPEHCQGLGPHDIASWEVEDQSDWTARGFRTRYRSVRRTDTPIEITPVKFESTSLIAREILTNEGLGFVVARGDGIALIEFSDGVVAKIRLQPHPSKPGWSVIVPGDVSNPIDAWPSVKSFQLVSFTPNGRQRRFVSTDDLGVAPQTLDFATFDEIILDATRNGGLGAYFGPSPNELTKSREKLQELINSFPQSRWESRRKRLELFLADSQYAEAARDSLTAYLTGQPAFKEAVESRSAQKADDLRETLRAEIRASEVEINQRIHDKENEFSEVAEMVQLETKQRDSLVGEVQALRQEKTSLEAELSKLRKERDAPFVPMVQAPHVGIQWLSASSETSISKPDALITLIEKNLAEIGINALMARQIGYEVVAAASLGQVSFFRGSLARPVAEAVGLSLAGESLRIVQVTLGTSNVLPICLEPSNSSQAVLILGANLACLDTYGEEIKRTVFQRCVFSNGQRLPVLLATLENGASSLPLHSALFDLGPVLDTDVLRWKMPTKEPVLVLGKLKAEALSVQNSEIDSELWEGIIQDTGATTGLWPGLALSVLKRLAGLTSHAKGSHPEMSFLFGWLLPRLLATTYVLDDYSESIKAALSAGTKPFDPRVLAILSACKLEGIE